MSWSRPLVLLVALAACGSTPETPVCAPGVVLACRCADGVPGTTTCNPEGAGFDACICGSSGSGGASASSGTGATGGSGQGGASGCPTNVGVGAACSIEGMTCPMSAACCGAAATCQSGTWTLMGTTCGDPDCGMGCGPSGLTCKKGALCVTDHTDGLGPLSSRCHPNTCPNEPIPQADCCEPICNEDGLNDSGSNTGICNCNCGTC